MTISLRTSNADHDRHVYRLRGDLHHRRLPRCAMKNGGPAFPREDYQGDSAPGQIGMTLRDYFAAAALSGVQRLALAHARLASRDDVLTIEEMASQAYEHADAMLKERAK